MSHCHDPDSHVLHLFPITDCCKVDEPGQVPHIGGLSHFGTVRKRTSAHRECDNLIPHIKKEREKRMNFNLFLITARRCRNESTWDDCRFVSCIRSYDA